MIDVYQSVVKMDLSCSGVERGGKESLDLSAGTLELRKLRLLGQLGSDNLAWEKYASRAYSVLGLAVTEIEALQSAISYYYTHVAEISTRKEMHE